jgi:hypothetical protein
VNKMPNHDGTGPDGKGPKKENKGFPMRDGRGLGRKGQRQGKVGGRGQQRKGQQK